jgi:hypothetical protein
MSRLRVHSFGISLDAYGAGRDQDLDNPLGRGGLMFHEYVSNASATSPSLLPKCDRSRHAPRRRSHRPLRSCVFVATGGGRWADVRPVEHRRVDGGEHEPVTRSPVDVSGSPFHLCHRLLLSWWRKPR